MKLPEIKLAKTESLVLRACRSDLTSRNGFKWKSKGIVTAPDWRPNKECGHGLHGWLRGVGKPGVWEHYNNDIWLVLAVKTKDLIDLDGKVKFPSCRVLFAGSREVATALAISHCPGAKVNYGTATAGDEGTATAGYKGTATAGYKGTATAGYKGTAAAGDEGTATAGDQGTATAGYKGNAT